MDEDYNFYDEDINQPNWPKVVIALLLIVVAVASYFGYQKFIKGKEKHLWSEKDEAVVYRCH